MAANLIRPIWADEPAGVEATEVEAIGAKLDAAGLGPVNSKATKRFLGVGNTSAGFRDRALDLCEGLADDYLRHFAAHGFAVALPADRLTVVVLRDAASLAAVFGGALGEAIGGFYDLDSNRLVLFDNRTAVADRGPAAIAGERANTITLFHEATHQLTFNTGPLDRQSDVPLLVSEGLAAYGETRRPDGRTRIGRVNAERLAVVAATIQQGDALIPIERLLVEDQTFRDESTRQLAYAQAWLFVYGLMSDRRRTSKFRAYLDRIRERKVRASRVADLESTIGPPADLDAQQVGSARRLARG